MPESKVYTLDEIAQHTDHSSCWILIHGKVYDVTQFLDSHPGGEEVLIEQGGKNATEPFEDIGHSSEARGYMLQYYIGELNDEEKKKLDDIQARASWPMNNDDSSWRNWLIPILVAILVSILYRFYFNYHV